MAKTNLQLIETTSEQFKQEKQKLVLFLKRIHKKELELEAAFDIINTDKPFLASETLLDILEKLGEHISLDLHFINDLNLKQLYERCQRSGVNEKLLIDILKKVDPLFLSFVSDGVEAWLRERFDFRRNTVTGHIEFKKAKTKDDFKQFKDSNLKSIWRELGKFKSLTWLSNTIESDFSPDFDPFHEYFNNLDKKDDSDYIQKLCDTVKINGDKDKFKTYFTKWLVASVGCSLGEIVNDTCLVFTGKQGIYKTTWLNNLVPKSLSTYLDVQKSINPDSKDSLISLTENFVINLDELATLNKTDIESLKSLFSRKDVKVRVPYGRYAENRQRRASFVGSINKDTFLTDSTGSRRWLIFEAISFLRDHDIDIDQVWKQAYDLYRSGYAYWFTQEEINELNNRNEKFNAVTTEEELVIRFCSPSEIKDKFHFMTATEIYQKIIEISNLKQQGSIAYSSRKVGEALKKLGFERKSNRVKGKNYSVQGYYVEISESEYEKENADLLHDENLSNTESQKHCSKLKNDLLHDLLHNKNLSNTETIQDCSKRVSENTENFKDDIKCVQKATVENEFDGFENLPTLLLPTTNNTQHTENKEVSCAVGEKTVLITQLKEQIDEKYNGNRIRAKNFIFSVIDKFEKGENLSIEEIRSIDPLQFGSEGVEEDLKAIKKLLDKKN